MCFVVGEAMALSDSVTRNHYVFLPRSEGFLHQKC